MCQNTNMYENTECGAYGPLISVVSFIYAGAGINFHYLTIWQLIYPYIHGEANSVQYQLIPITEKVYELTFVVFT